MLLSSFDESLKNPEQCPQMIPKYFANVQPKGGFDNTKIGYSKPKPAPKTKEQCVQQCCAIPSCHIVFMYMDNNTLTCFHVSYFLSVYISTLLF